MKVYVVVTDRDWYRFLHARPAIDEVDVWHPPTVNDDHSRGCEQLLSYQGAGMNRGLCVHPYPSPKFAAISLPSWRDPRRLRGSLRSPSTTGISREVQEDRVTSRGEP